MSAVKAVKNSGEILTYLLVLGFLGILWLVIYGNLSGNLGFGKTSSSYVNQTMTLNKSASPAGTYGKVNPVLTNVLMTNATGGNIVVAANYSLTGATFGNSTGDWAGASVNVSYDVSYDTDGKVNTDTVITNMTSGTKTFFSYSNTLFTVTAIGLLVTILLSLLAIVMKIVKQSKGSGGFASE